MHIPNYDTIHDCDKELDRLKLQAEELKRQAKISGGEPSEWILQMMRERYTIVKSMRESIILNNGTQERLI